MIEASFANKYNNECIVLRHGRTTIFKSILIIVKRAGKQPPF
jgi:hypothetical protein